MSIPKLTAAMFLSSVALLLVGGAVGYRAHNATKASAMFPTYAQVAEGEAALTHDYLSVLAHAPDFIACDHGKAPRLVAVPAGHAVTARCIYLMTFTDDSSTYYAVYLDRAADPIAGERLKGLPMPQPA